MRVISLQFAFRYVFVCALRGHGFWARSRKVLEHFLKSHAHITSRLSHPAITRYYYDGAILIPFLLSSNLHHVHKQLPVSLHFHIKCPRYTSYKPSYQKYNGNDDKEKKIPKKNR